MATPFIDTVFTFTQPDGTTFEVRGSGNQYSADFGTLDGYAIVKDEAGFYHRAQRAGDGSLRAFGPPLGAVRTAAVEAFEAQELTRAVKGRTTFPTALDRRPLHWERVRAGRIARLNAGLEAPPTQRVVGNYLGLVLPVRFNGEPNAPELPIREIENFCNLPNYSGNQNKGSVRDYFFAMSAGRLTYTNRVAPYFTAPQTRGYYNDKSVAYGQRSRELVYAALAYHKAHGFSFAGLTVNEGRVRAINVLYTGNRPPDEDHGTGLWPHMGELWPHDVDLGGARAHEYQVCDMRDGLTLGTFCHENGHMICDFPDLYDFHAPKSCGAGRYCLMAHGANDEKNPTHVGAYLKHAAGWTTKIIELAPNMNVSLQAGKNELAIWRRPGVETEYYLIENRFRDGRDKGLTDFGLAIWRIDERGDNQNESHTPESHYECALMQADGKYELEGNKNAGNETDLYRAVQFPVFSSATNPNNEWWDGTPSGMTIYDISAPGDVMTFKTR